MQKHKNLPLTRNLNAIIYGTLSLIIMLMVFSCNDEKSHNAKIYKQDFKRSLDSVKLNINDTTAINTNMLFITVSKNKKAMDPGNTPCHELNKIQRGFVCPMYILKYDECSFFLLT